MNPGPQNVLALATVEAWLCEHLAKRLDISASEIDIQRDFSSFGLASVEALNLVRDLEDWVGLKLTPTLAWDYPTVAALARHIVQATAARPDITNEFSNAPNQPTNNSEPIAIVGIGCRYPGAENVQALWKLLCQGEDAITALQDDRWDPERYYHPDPSAPGKMVTRLGGFLPKLDEFDAQFFGISPREAPHVDPRQRLMLEVTWEALEDAGIPPYALAGTNTGVYVAILSNDYDQLLSRNLNRIDAYTGPGTANSILANRISYWLDLHGVSIAIDTACSGSLVAVHLACQGLHRGEFSMALVGGVNLNLLPKSNVFFTKAGALSSNGRCKTFDDEADGIVRSDGAGMIVLKPLAQAQADGDPIYAAICGSALNHDGRSNGIMAPNGQAQQQMLREAYRQAGITPDQVQYIEAHGTGTRLGDPIEVTALGAILATNRQPDHPCVLGSIKTNIGHTEAAAGIASLIKAALAIRYRMIPPNLHYQKPNVLIPFDELPFTVYQELSPWPSPDQPLIAGVSGFGFGGTNAHVVLQEGPQPVQSLSVSETDQPYLVPLSAHTPEALHQLAQAYRETLLNEQTRPALPDMAYTAAVRRSHHPQRLALVARSNEDVVESLSAFLDGEEHPRIINGTTPANDGGKLAFVFSGQGSHWIKMGLNLFASEPIFRQTLTQCDELLRWYVKWSLLDELTAPESASRLHETDVTQPAIFAIQAALADLWSFWGIVPDMIVGHSLGEVAATYAAGILTLEDAIHIVFHRSRLMKQVAGRGKTAVVGLSMAEAQGVLAGFEARLAVAGSNSPTTSVLAGDPETLHQILNSLQERKVFCRELKGINIAFHSPQMDPLRNELVEVLNGLMPQPARIPIFSTLTGQTAQGSDFVAEYWGRNLREPFRFTEVTEALIAAGCTTFLEVSPHPVLAPSLLQTVQHLGGQATIVSSLKRNTDEKTTMLSSLGRLYTLNYAVDWARSTGTMLYPAQARHVSLPTYPWQRTRYWFDQLTDTSDEVSGPVNPKHGDHPLLGEYLEPANAAEANFWQVDLNAFSTVYLADHQVLGAIIMPGAAYAEMALAAAQAIFKAEQIRINELHFERALRLSDQGTTRVQSILSRSSNHQATLEIYSREKGHEVGTGKWTRHAQAQLDITPPSGDIQPEAIDLTMLKARYTETIDGADHYAKMTAQGLNYGPHFQSIQTIWRHDGEAVSYVELPTETLFPRSLQNNANTYHVHPVILDAAFQTVAATLADDNDNDDLIYLPHSLAGLHFYQPPGNRVWCQARLKPSARAGAEQLEADLMLINEAGQVVVTVACLRLQRLQTTTPSASKETQDLLYDLRWEAADSKNSATVIVDEQKPAHWIIFADRQGVGDALTRQVAHHGHSHTVVRANNGDPENEGPHQPDALRQRLANNSPHEACNIVYLWGLDVTTPEAISNLSLTEDRLTRHEPLIHLVQSVNTAAGTPKPKLWIVTQYAQAVTAEDVPTGFTQAPLWGIGRVIALEHPELYGGLIDLDSAGNDNRATQLWHEIRFATVTSEAAPEVAFRDGIRHVPRLHQQATANARQVPPKMRCDGTYLITGGLSGLGLLVAHWMVGQGARRLILLGRTPLPPRNIWDNLPETDEAIQRINAIRALEHLGASVHYAALDIAHEEELVAFLDAYRRASYPPLRGVVHAAGVLDDQLLMHMDAKSLAKVMQPKVQGSWTLHYATHSDPLDFFVLFSSASAILGNWGQANYAAGNSFMDILAHYRQAQGLPARSINWGPWAQVGMYARFDSENQDGRNIVTPLNPEQGMEAFAFLFNQRIPQAMVIDAAWHRLPPTPLLANLAQKEGAEIEREADGVVDENFLLTLLLAEPTEQKLMIETEIAKIAGQVFHSGSEQLNRQPPLPELGLDSLMAVELKNLIARRFDVDISMADLFTSSISDLRDKVESRLQSDDDLERLLDEVEKLSMDEVDLLLDDEIITNERGALLKE